MAVSSGKLAPKRPRRRSEFIALAVFGVLLLFQLVYLGLGLASRNLIVAAGTYQIEETMGEKVIAAMPEGRLFANARQEARAAFRDVTPEFRAHRPVVDVAPEFRGRRPVVNFTRFVVTVLVTNRAGLRPMFESIGQRLDELIREQQQLPPGAPLFQLIDVEVKPYPWLKPLDIVSVLVLLGAGGAWIFLP